MRASTLCMGILKVFGVLLLFLFVIWVGGLVVQTMVCTNQELAHEYEHEQQLLQHQGGDNKNKKLSTNSRKQLQEEPVSSVLNPEEEHQQDQVISTTPQGPDLNEQQAIAQNSTLQEESSVVDVPIVQSNTHANTDESNQCVIWGYTITSGFINPIQVTIGVIVLLGFYILYQMARVVMRCAKALGLGKKGSGSEFKKNSDGSFSVPDDFGFEDLEKNFGSASAKKE